MPVTIKVRNKILKKEQQKKHANCYVCSPDNSRGMQVQFSACGENCVEGVFPCADIFQGYDKQLHGGIISSLLDGAMTNCLFAQGITAVTGELSIRFYQPVATGKMVKVTARIKKPHPPFYLLEAHLTQDNNIMAKATGKFYEIAEEDVSP